MSGGRDYFELGQWNIACSMCGRKRKSSEVVRNWQGQWRCYEHNEQRNVQEYVRAVPDIQTPPFVQDETNVFAGVCFPNDQTAISDYGVADCMVADYVSPFFTPDTGPPSPLPGETVQFIGVSAFNAVGSTSALVTMPANILDGDYMILCAVPDLAASAINTPFGWTEFSFSPLSDNPPTGDRLRMFWRIASGEPPSFLMTKTLATSWHGIIFAYRGCNVAAPVNVTLAELYPDTVFNTWASAGVTTTVTYTKVITVVTPGTSVGIGRTIGPSPGAYYHGSFSGSIPANWMPIMLQDQDAHLTGPTGPFGGSILPGVATLVVSIALASTDSV